MSAKRSIALLAKLQRKGPELPVFVVMPGKAVAPWKLAGTTVLEGTAQGQDCGRRTLKAWGKGSDDGFWSSQRRSVEPLA
jgi:hypothetical protein